MEKDSYKILKKIKPYGDAFDGRYMKVEELRYLIPRFKEFYFQKKIEFPKIPQYKIICDFNEIIKDEGLRFYPWPNQYRVWYDKWGDELGNKIGKLKTLSRAPEVIAVKVKNDDSSLLVPTEADIESGAKTLAGELVNDAMSILKGDQEVGEEGYDDEILIKRRNYVLSVYRHVMASVHRKEGLQIKKRAEQRETAGFLMDLIRESVAGNISEKDMLLIKEATAVKTEK